MMNQNIEILLKFVQFHFFHSPISREQRSIENAMIMFSVKDQDFLGISNKYIAECFITFDEIARSDPMEQIHLKLSRPTVAGLLFKYPETKSEGILLILDFLFRFHR